MTDISGMSTYADGQTLPAAKLTNDFTNIVTAFNTFAVQTNKAVTVTVGHTFTATQTYTPASGFALDVTTGGFRVQAGGGEVTGNLLVTGEVRSIDSSVNTRVRSVNASSVGQVGTFSNHDLWFVTNSTQRIALTAAGHLVPISSGSYDLGLTGSRWRDGWFGGNLTVAGNITFSGSLTGGTFGATTFGGLITGNSGLTISSGTSALQATTATTLSVSSTAQVTGVLTSLTSAALGAASELASSATAGFVYIPRTSGAPSGTPTAHTDRCALVVDASNNRLYVYNSSTSSWRYATLT